MRGPLHDDTITSKMQLRTCCGSPLLCHVPEKHIRALGAGTDPAVSSVPIQDAEDESLRRYKEKVWPSPPNHTACYQKANLFHGQQIRQCGLLLKTHHDCNLDLTRTNAKFRQLLGEAAKGTVAADPNDPRRVVITELR
jgi:hypothetical protein